MENVTVSKAQLLEIVRINRDKHRGIFLEALEVYREHMINHLNSMIDDISKGKKVDHIIRLPVPEDHTSDYDKVIKMLQMELRDEVTIDDVSFANFVLDQWQWTKNFEANTVSYTTNRR